MLRLKLHLVALPTGHFELYFIFIQAKPLIIKCTFTWNCANLFWLLRLLSHLYRCRCSERPRNYISKCLIASNVRRDIKMSLDLKLSMCIYIVVIIIIMLLLDHYTILCKLPRLTFPGLEFHIFSFDDFSKCTNPFFFPDLSTCS